MNPYDVLGVGSGATDEEVHAAWRRIARRTHPDTGGDPEAFVGATSAYRALLRRRRRPPTVVVVGHHGAAALALRWWQRRRDRIRHPRVL